MSVFCYFAVGGLVGGSIALCVCGGGGVREIMFALDDIYYNTVLISHC